MRISLLLFLCFYCGITHAQTTVLKGKIMDSNDSFSLPGAALRIEEGNKYTVSDANGNFEFLNLPAGTYTLSVDYLGYKHYAAAIKTTTGAIEIYLEPASNALDE